MTGSVLASIGFTQTGLTVTVSPDTAYGYRYGTGSLNTTTSNVAVARGGTLPYSYAWTYVSGDTSIVANSPNVASTRFSAFFGSPDFRTAVFKCVVTDANAVVVDSNIVSVVLESN